MGLKDFIYTWKGYVLKLFEHPGPLCTLVLFVENVADDSKLRRCGVTDLRRPFDVSLAPSGSTYELMFGWSRTTGLRDDIFLCCSVCMMSNDFLLMSECVFRFQMGLVNM